MKDIDLCFYSPASRGGAGWFVAALAQAVGDAGKRILLVSPEMVPADREPSGENIERKILIAGKAGKASLPVRVARTAWRIGSTFPILIGARWRTRNFMITMFDWIPVLVLQMIVIKAFGGRIAFVVHDVTPHAWAFPSRLLWLERWLYRLSYSLPDRIIVLTAAAQHEMSNAWGRTQQVHVIPHGTYIHGEPEPLPGNGIILVFGMLRRNKRILESIQAMRLLAAEGTILRMVIAGEPHVDDLDYWRDCLSALAGLEDYVTVEPGFVPEARTRQLFAQADALLVPYEDFSSQSGVAILGAMAQRIIIATPVGGMAELIEAGLEAIEVAVPVTPEGVAAALRKMADIPLSEQRDSTSRSRSSLAFALSWERIGRQYADLLSQTDTDHRTQFSN